MVRAGMVVLVLALLLTAGTLPAMAQPAEHHGGEANLVLPNLDQVTFLGGANGLGGVGGRTLLLIGIGVCVLGLLFGLMIYSRLEKMPVHKSMKDVSELIYTTCKAYLRTQGKFLLLLECFIGVIIVLYFGVLQGFAAYKVAIIVFFSLVGISGSFFVAAFGMRVNTFANSRTVVRGADGARRIRVPRSRCNRA